LETSEDGEAKIQKVKTRIETSNEIMVIIFEFLSDLLAFNLVSTFHQIC